MSYNNLLDVDAATNLMQEFIDDGPTFAITKHNNACGLATRDTVIEAYDAALAGDPVSAFGGVLISNTIIDKATATQIHELFCEVLIAPAFDEEGLKILMQKKNRILLESKPLKAPSKTVRSVLNGYLVQDKDSAIETEKDLKNATKAKPFSFGN